jgi:serine phosphatase RsbU (regulator of sigma subunit)
MTGHHPGNRLPYRVASLLLVSDGLPEQKNTNDEMFDYERVQTVFSEVAQSRPDDIIQHLVKAGDDWMKGATQEDDITLMVLQAKDSDSTA